MEVNGREVQILRTHYCRDYGTFSLVYDEENRSYLYIHEKKGIRLGLEWAGLDEANALDGFADYSKERSVGAY